MNPESYQSVYGPSALRPMMGQYMTAIRQLEALARNPYVRYALVANKAGRPLLDCLTGLVSALVDANERMEKLALDAMAYQPMVIHHPTAQFSDEDRETLAKALAETKGELITLPAGPPKYHWFSKRLCARCGERPRMENSQIYCEPCSAVVNQKNRPLDNEMPEVGADAGQLITATWNDKPQDIRAHLEAMNKRMIEMTGTPIKHAVGLTEAQTNVLNAMNQVENLTAPEPCPECGQVDCIGCAVGMVGTDEPEPAALPDLPAESWRDRAPLL